MVSKTMVFRKDLIDSVHISVSSLRRASDVIYDEAESMIRSMRFREVTDDAVEWRRSFWAWMGLADDWVDSVMAVDPWFDYEVNTLFVSPSLEADAKRTGKVRSVIMYILQWVDFSDTRWAGLTVSARKYIASLAVGTACYYYFGRLLLRRLLQRLLRRLRLLRLLRRRLLLRLLLLRLLLVVMQISAVMMMTMMVMMMMMVKSTRMTMQYSNDE